MGVWLAMSERGFTKPQSMRRRVCRALAVLKDKDEEGPWKKHGNLPL